MIGKLKKLKYWRQMLWDWRHRKHQRRVAPYGARGRTHELVDPATAPNDGSEAGNVIRKRAIVAGNIRARVYRASTGEWEDLGVIARATMEQDDGKP